MVYLAICRQELQQKSWKTARLFIQDRDQDQDQMFKAKTKTFIFDFEAPRDHDPGLEDYVTGKTNLSTLLQAVVNWDCWEKSQTLAARSGCESPLETVEVDLTDPDPIFYDRSMPLVYLASEGWR